MAKNLHTKACAGRMRVKNEESIRYVPIPPIVTDVRLERFFDYAQRLAELEDQLRAESAVGTIDIDRL
jgi:hypothetical protein